LWKDIKANRTGKALKHTLTTLRRLQAQAQATKRNPLRMSAYTLLRIPVSGDVPCEFVNFQADAPEDRLYAHLREVCGWTGDGVSSAGAWVSFNNYKFYDINGKHKSYEVYFCGEGLDLKLQPNHRANAMAGAGMYLPSGSPDEKARQFQLKQAWGCNWFVGDIVIRIKKGQALPDASIYGDNPFKWMLERATPIGATILANPTAQYKSKHTDWFARANLMMYLTDAGTGTQYQRGDYKFHCPDSMTAEFRDTLFGWMEGCGCFKMDNVRKHPDFQ